MQRLKTTHSENFPLSPFSKIAFLGFRVGHFSNIRFVSDVKRVVFFSLILTAGCEVVQGSPKRIKRSEGGPGRGWEYVKEPFSYEVGVR